jgi:hypothetical protein
MPPKKMTEIEEESGSGENESGNSVIMSALWGN